MSRWALLLAFASLAGCVQGKKQNISSKELAAAKDRVQYFCSQTVCPSKPLDVAYTHEVTPKYVGPLPAGESWELHAVVRIKTDDALHWARGCDEMRFHPRPPWVDALFAERGVDPKLKPDIWGCPESQRRVIHVKEGIVILWMKSAE